MRRSWALVLLGLAVLPAAASAKDTPLFVPERARAGLAAGQAERVVPAGLGVLRTRTVRFDASALPGADGARPLPTPGHPVLLNLFTDVVKRARMVRTERLEKGMAWVGRLEGQPLSDVILTVYDGILSGSVVWPGGAYRIRFDGHASVVEQIDQGQFPDDHCFEEVPGGRTAGAARFPAFAFDDGSTIDVLVAYTPAARAAAGGTAAMQSLANLAVTETNTGYANSGVVQRLRLAGTAEVGLTEAAADIAGDLGRLTNPSDGVIDDVHALRDASHADLVALIGEGYASGSGACGIAWLMSGDDPAFAPHAFSVIDRTCATGNYSFGHELGHNMGLNHARTDPVLTGAFSYSFGYKDPANTFRTVMAYNCPVNCPRILRFSNPGLSYGGKPTGIAEADVAHSANNALSLNNTRATVASWRAADPLARAGSVWHTWFAVNALETPNVGDFNGDGLTDIVTFTRQNPSAVGDVYVALSDGARFGTSAKWHDWFAITTDETVVIGDFDGDGKDDIATWLGKTTRQVYVARSLGTGMSAESVWLDSIGTDATEVLMSGDANGDGKKDLICFARTQGKVYVALSDGKKFAPPTVWHNGFAVSTYERPRVADVDGDGRADIVTFGTDSPTAFGDVYVARSDGTRFVDGNGASDSSSKWHDWFAIRPAEQVRVGDLNGDGKDDFFTFLPPPFAQCYTVLSQGTSMAANVLWPVAVGPHAKDVPFVGDVDGDGKADIILFAQGEGKVYVSLAP